VSRKFDFADDPTIFRQLLELPDCPRKSSIGPFSNNLAYASSTRNLNRQELSVGQG